MKEMLVTVHLAPGIRQSLCEDQGPLVQRVVVVQAVHVLVVEEFFHCVFWGKDTADSNMFDHWNKCLKKDLVRKLKLPVAQPDPKLWQRRSKLNLCNSKKTYFQGHLLSRVVIPNVVVGVFYAKSNHLIIKYTF